MKPSVFSQGKGHVDPRHLRGVKVRFGIIGFLFMLAILIAPVQGLDFFFPSILVVISLAFVSNFLSYVWIISGKKIQYRIYFAPFVDVFLVTAAVHYIGGIETPASWIYAVVIIAFASIHGVRIGIYTAAVSSLMYTSLLLAEYSGLIEHIGFDFLNPVYIHQAKSYITIKLLTDNFLFFVAAIVSGILSERLIRSTGELEKRNEQLQKEVAERRRAEESLRESEERYKGLFENSIEGSFTVDVEGAFTTCNPAAEEMLGYSLAELVEMNYQDCIVPVDWEKASKEYDTLFRTGTPLRNGLCDIIRKDGERRTIESNATAVKKGNRVIGFQVTIRDITDRRKAEVALRESEEKYRTLVENTSDVIYSVDKDGVMTFISPGMKSFAGYSPSEVIGRVFTDLIYPEDRLRLRENFEKTVAGQPQANEYRVVTKEGGVQWMCTSSRPIIREGQYVGAQGVFSDITKRKRAEDALRESEEKYRTLFEESQDVVFISTPSGEFVDINPAGVKLFGYSSERELLDIDIAQDLYINPEDRKAYGTMMAQQGFVKDYELALKKKDGQDIIVLATANAVYDNDRNVVAYRGFMRDITEKKQLEKQFFQAQKMESVGTLAGGIAHDFNNLLGGILGYASLARSKLSEGNPVFNYLGTIERSATRAAELTAQLLAFARGGKYETKLININTMVNETLEIISRTFDKSIEIETHLGAALPTVEADAAQIEQIIMNLCINARDAIQGKGKLIIETGTVSLPDSYVKTHSGLKAGSYVLLSVTDSGIGMTRETRERVFEPFFTTKAEGKGTGLGLSMVYGVAKNHGGHVSVYSEVDEGSTFKIYLPANGKPTTKDISKTERPVGGDELILIVDDEESIRSLATDILEGYGYRVLCAEDGEEAIRIYSDRKDEIHLAILDMIMPRMGGREALLKLKEIDPQIRTILSTGYSQNGKAKDFLTNGFMGFVQKPYRINTLLIEVRRVLDKKLQVA